MRDSQANEDAIVHARRVTDTARERAGFGRGVGDRLVTPPEERGGDVCLVARNVDTKRLRLSLAPDPWRAVADMSEASGCEVELVAVAEDGRVVLGETLERLAGDHLGGGWFPAKASKRVLKDERFRLVR